MCLDDFITKPELRVYDVLLCRTISAAIRNWEMIRREFRVLDLVLREVQRDEGTAAKSSQADATDAVIGGQMHVDMAAPGSTRLAVNHPIPIELAPGESSVRGI